MMIYREKIWPSTLKRIPLPRHEARLGMLRKVAKVYRPHLDLVGPWKTVFLVHVLDIFTIVGMVQKYEQRIAELVNHLGKQEC